MSMDRLRAELEQAARNLNSNAEYGSITTSVGEQLHLALLLRRAAEALVRSPREPELLEKILALKKYDAGWDG